MNWYYSIEGHATGPASEETLVEMAHSGAVTTDTLIWHPALAEWEPVWKLKPDIIKTLNKSAMARQAKGTTDHVLVAAVALLEAPRAELPIAPAPSAGFFSRLFGGWKKK